MKYFIIALLFTSCMQAENKENRQLDIEVEEIQRLSFWHREYYFEELKWKGKNTDSALYYEHKRDSVVRLYKMQMLRYDSLVKLYKEQK